ncbi:MAG: hypothetical protein QOF76_822 [Solirubrobacteraceae bacterium]|nr:hypothetical protein [Solirubrobacteraceae bacterium]
MTDWLPPQAPTHPPDGALPRATGALPRPPRAEAGPRRSVRETISLGLGSVSIVLLVMTVGVSFFISLLMSSLAMWMGKQTGRRAAVVVGLVGVVIAGIAAITWTILYSQGITPQDLQDSLQRSLDRARAR